jgi:hypothetical protein
MEFKMDRIWVIFAMFIMGVLAILYMANKLTSPIQLVNWIPAPLYSILFTVIMVIVAFAILFAIAMRLSG